MDQKSHIARDYGLAIGLLLAAGAVLWWTLLPLVDENKTLDRGLRAVQAQNAQKQDTIERLVLQKDAETDPLTVERLARRYFGDLVIPPEEIRVLKDDQDAPPDPAGPPE